MTQKITKAIFPAAGYGTRFLPATKASPKEMLPIVDTPIIQLAAEEAIASGIEEIVIITNRNKQSIENHFDKAYELERELEKAGKYDLLDKVKETYENIQVVYTRQKQMRGLGDAILTAKNLIGDEPFAVILADDVIFGQTPCLKQMMDVYEKTNASVVASQQVKKADVSKYGILEIEHKNQNIFEIKDMIEKPSIQKAPSNQAIIGRYILEPEIFDILEDLPAGSGGEIQLTDAMQKLLETKKIYGLQFEGKRFDTGSVLGFLQATTYWALKREDTKELYRDYLNSIL